MNTPNTLVPAVVEQAVKPKPTKREITDALATLHIEQVKEANKKIVERRKILDEQIENGLKALLHRRGISKFKVDAHQHFWSGNASATLSIDFRSEDLSEALKVAIKERETSHEKCVPCLYDARKQVIKKMSGMAPHDERVAALLSDSKSKAALEAMLTALAK